MIESLANREFKMAQIAVLPLHLPRGTKSGHKRPQSTDRDLNSRPPKEVLDNLMYVCPCIIYEIDERYPLDATVYLLL